MSEIPTGSERRNPHLSIFLTSLLLVVGAIAAERSFGSRTEKEGEQEVVVIVVEKPTPGPTTNTHEVPTKENIVAYKINTPESDLEKPAATGSLLPNQPISPKNIEDVSVPEIQLLQERLNQLKREKQQMPQNSGRGR